MDIEGIVGGVPGGALRILEGEHRGEQVLHCPDLCLLAHVPPALWYIVDNAGVNMLALHFLGNKIRTTHGARYVWMLYLAGAGFGSIVMNYYMPYEIVPIPKVGADPGISAFISFLITMTPRATFNFLFPVKYWILLPCAMGFVVVTDSSGKNFGGLAVGVGIGLLRRSLIL